MTQKEYYQQNKWRWKGYKQKHNLLSTSKEKVKEYNKIYNQRPENKIKNNERIKQKMKNDIQYRLSVLLRKRINKLLKGINYSKHSIELLGCSVKEYENHLESTFTDGMNWNKVMSGEIQIDHKIPCIAFNLEDIEQQKICFNWKNTQCLWAKDNKRKIKEDMKLNWRNI